MLYKTLDYRNASYSGSVLRSYRHGNGILITDDSYILLSNWKENIMDGPYVYLFENNFIFGNSKEGKLEKFNLIITPEVKIYANYKGNRIDKKCMIEDGNGVRMFKFENGRKVGAGAEVQEGKVRETVWREFGEDVMNIKGYIEKFLDKEEIRNGTRIRSMKISEHYKYYGGLNEQGECQNLGFILNTSNNKIFSCGHYKNGNLHGLGRTYQGDSLLFDGIFQNGQFKNLGVKYNTVTNSYTDARTQQSFSGDPTPLIKSIRKQFHLRSINYINQMILISTIIKIKISDITDQTPQVPVKSNIQNTSHSSNRSPPRSSHQYQQKSMKSQSHQSPATLTPNRVSKKSLFNNHYNHETKTLLESLQSKQPKRIDLHEIYRKTKLKK